MTATTDAARATNALDRVLAWFGEGQEWDRPPLTRADQRFDLALALGLAVGAALSLELMRSLGMLAGLEPGVVEQHLMLLVGFVPVVWRRRYPVAVAILSQAHFMWISYTIPAASMSVILQVIYVISVYTAVAWSRNRTVAAGFAAAMCVYVTAWVLYSFAAGNAADQFMELTAGNDRGLIGPIAAAMVYMTFINGVILAFAIYTGRNAWWGARDRAALAEQAETIARQSEELREQAVMGERLRIARELHDVVAHHVAVTGVQAAAARKALDTRPDLAALALGHVEDASRTAVTEMRSLLGTLRREDSVGAPRTDELERSRTREQSLADLPQLVASYQGAGLETELQLVGGEHADLEAVSAAPALAAYRIVQESLTNVSRHSSATHALVVVRFLEGRAEQPGLLELEITDNGRPRGGTSGSGLGQVGMRERVQVAGGEIEMGPRSVGGYRVRARLPLQLS